LAGSAPRVSIGAGAGIAVPCHGDFNFMPWAWDGDVRLAMSPHVRLEGTVGELRRYFIHQGTVLLRLGLPDQAIAAFDQALGGELSAASRVAASNNRGSALANKRPATALYGARDNPDRSEPAVNLERMVHEKRARLDRLAEAFLYEKSISRETYRRQEDLLREQLAQAEIELNDSAAEHLDVEGALAFAEHLVGNAARLWMELNQKQRLQAVLFPEGLAFDGKTFGTVVTCLAFKKFEDDCAPKSGLASPTGFEPVFWP
jgi:hypothetical protein